MSDPGYPKSTNRPLFFTGGWDDALGNPVPGASYSFSDSYAATGDDKAGQDTPGWPDFYRENDYYRSGYRVDCSPTNWSGTTTDGWQGSGTWNNLIHEFGPGNRDFDFDSLTSRVRAKAIAKLQSQIKDQKVNAGMALATADQTANLVANTAKKILQTVISLKHGNIKRAIVDLTGKRSKFGEHVAHNAGGVPEQWLALQYGWKPLLSDVYGAINGLSNVWKTKPDYCTSEVSVGDRSEKRITYPGMFDLPIEASHNGTCRVSGAIHYRVGNSAAAAAANVGVTDPLAVAWDLVPWSFVVDWFLPVGNFLNNLDFAQGMEFSSGWLVTKRKNSWSFKILDGLRVSGGTTQHFQGGSRVETGFEYNREVLSSFPAVSFPSFKNPLSLTHAANALSLMAGAFGRR